MNTESQEDTFPSVWIHERTQHDKIPDTLGEKCHLQPQHHKDIYDKLIHDKIVHGNLRENCPSHPRHTGTDDGTPRIHAT